MADKNVIITALDFIKFVDLLAQDFEAKSFSRIVAISKGEFSSTKIHNMLTTLEVGGWAVKDSNDNWRLSPRFAAIASSYQSYITQRANQLLEEVAKTTGKERIENAEK